MSAPFFQAAYVEGTPPWDIGRPQGEFIRLCDSGAVSGDVLDVGCGTGENALYAASLGLEVTGIDGAAAAIDAARRKADVRGIAATFVVGDVLDLGAYSGAMRFARAGRWTPSTRRASRSVPETPPYTLGWPR